jgi:hypothetical protein
MEREHYDSLELVLPFLALELFLARLLVQGVRVGCHCGVKGRNGNRGTNRHGRHGYYESEATIAAEGGIVRVLMAALGAEGHLGSRGLALSSRCCGRAFHGLVRYSLSLSTACMYCSMYEYNPHTVTDTVPCPRLVTR